MFRAEGTNEPFFFSLHSFFFSALFLSFFFFLLCKSNMLTRKLEKWEGYRRCGHLCVPFGALRFFFNGNNSGCNVTQKWDNDVGFYYVIIYLLIIAINLLVLELNSRCFIVSCNFLLRKNTLNRFCCFYC